MKKADRQQLYKLLERWTRAEVVARLVPFRWVDFGDAFWEKLRCEDQIRKLMFGTSNLVELGQRWGLPLHRVRANKKHKKLKNHTR